jgi:hypothetical protein
MIEVTCPNCSYKFSKAQGTIMLEVSGQVRVTVTNDGITPQILSQNVNASEPVRSTKPVVKCPSCGFEIQYPPQKKYLQAYCYCGNKLPQIKGNYCRKFDRLFCEEYQKRYLESECGYCEYTDSCPIYQDREEILS